MPHIIVVHIKHVPGKHVEMQDRMGMYHVRVPINHTLAQHVVDSGQGGQYWFVKVYDDAFTFTHQTNQATYMEWEN